MHSNLQAVFLTAFFFSLSSFAHSPQALELATKLAKTECNDQACTSKSSSIGFEAIDGVATLLDQYCTPAWLAAFSSKNKPQNFEGQSLRCKAITTIDHNACHHPEKAVFPCARFDQSSLDFAVVSAALADASLDMVKLYTDVKAACSPSEIGGIRMSSRFILLMGYSVSFAGRRDLSDKCRAALPDSIKSRIIVSHYVATKLATMLGKWFSANKFARSLEKYCDDQDLSMLVESVDHPSDQTRERINTEMSEKCGMLIASSPKGLDHRAEWIAILDDSGMSIDEAAQIIRTHCTSKEIDVANLESGRILFVDSPKNVGEFQLTISDKCLARLPKDLQKQLR
jgi:hypothetical protein